MQTLSTWDEGWCRCWLLESVCSSSVLGFVLPWSGSHRGQEEAVKTKSDHGHPGNGIVWRWGMQPFTFRQQPQRPLMDGVTYPADKQIQHLTCWNDDCYVYFGTYNAHFRVTSHNGPRCMKRSYIHLRSLSVAARPSIGHWCVCWNRLGSSPLEQAGLSSLHHVL